MSLRSDCLLATTGIFPEAITPKEHVAARDMLPRWEKKLRAWVTGPLGAFVYVPPPDMEKVFTQLATDPPEATVAAWIDGLGVDEVDLLADYAVPGTGLARARAYVVTVWPKYTIDSPSGPQILPLSTDDAHEVWSLVQVLDDPDRVLEEMAAATLTTTQANAFLTCYPDLHAWALGIIDDELAKRRAKSPDYSVGTEKEAVLATLKGLPPEEPMPQPEPPPQPDKDFKLDTDREKTQGDVSAAPKVRK